MRMVLMLMLKKREGGVAIRETGFYRKVPKAILAGYPSGARRMLRGLYLSEAVTGQN